MHKWYEKWAKKNGFTINKDNEKLILSDLMANQDKHGARFCPCKTELITDNICPCGQIRTLRECHCGLFAELEKN